MTENGLLEYIFDRLGRADAAEEIFGADEAADWPAGALDTLTKAGLLRRAQPTQVIECTGCEENCIMPVHVFPAEDNRPARAFISCDKRDDVGRVPVDMRRLEQWQTTGGLIADALAQLLGFSQTVHKAVDGKQWNIGVLKGTTHKSLVTLLAKDNLNLSLAGHTIPLIEVLTIKENVLTLDKGELIRLVNKPAGNNETPEERRKRLKARVHEEKAKGTKAFLQLVADEEGISVSRLKQLTSDKHAPADTWSNLIGPTKRPSSKKNESKY